MLEQIGLNCDEDTDSTTDARFVLHDLRLKHVSYWVREGPQTGLHVLRA